jgi:hypothetical protein
MRPLLAPTRPGGYDYALGGYFARLGATGFVLGYAKPVPPSVEMPTDIQLFTFIEKIRRALTTRILQAIPGETGAVGTALISGVRDQISPEVNEAMRNSGLYHVLSISGLHMAIVAGVIFAFIRGGLALIPGFALRYLIKKWTAFIALIGSYIYMTLAGADAPTLRSFIMISLVLLGVMLDRPGTQRYACGVCAIISHLSASRAEALGRAAAERQRARAALQCRCRQMDSRRRAHVLAGGARDNALCRVSFSAARALRADRECAGDARDFLRHHADGGARCRADPVRL